MRPRLLVPPPQDPTVKLWLCRCSQTQTLCERYYSHYVSTVQASSESSWCFEENAPHFLGMYEDTSAVHPTSWPALLMPQHPSPALGVLGPYLCFTVLAVPFWSRSTDGWAPINLEWNEVLATST